MAYEFMSLAEVEALPEVPENATVLAEVGGSIKRIPGEGLGGSGNNLVIVESSFTDFYTGLSTAGAMPSCTYTANMEFADALAAFRACELTNTVMYANTADGPSCLRCDVCDFGAIDCLVIIAYYTSNTYVAIYWTADGISTESPSTGK